MSQGTRCGCTITIGAGNEWRIYHCSLHAAAPDLLTALEAVLAEPNDRNWAAARAAVRKATAS